MKTLRFAAAIASIGAALAVPTGALAAGSGTPTSSSQITPTAPSRLSTSTTTTTTAPATMTAATTTAAHAGTLPNTGFDLLPETVLGITLVGVGIGVRAVRSRV